MESAAAFPLSICRSFEANAWRSDFCCHCFQSRQEHSTAIDSAPPDPSANQQVSAAGRLHDNASRYQSLMTSYRHSPVAMTTTPSSPVATAAAAGILKAANRQQKKKINVKFGHDEDVVVIGYGGVEFFDGDVDDESDGVTGDDEDDFTYTDEDRRIQNLTLKNTSFNSVSRNLTAGEAVVAAFSTHGGLAGSAGKAAPLVTISSFGEKPSAMGLRNGHKPTAWFGGVRPLDQEMKIIQKAEAATLPQEEEDKKAKPQVAKQPEAPEAPEAPETPEEEKFTSFCDPPPPPEAVTIEPEASDVAASAGSPPSGADSSKRSSNLSRKAPVFKEKPHVAIKPQSEIPESKLPESKKTSSSSSSSASGKVNKMDFILGPWNGHPAISNAGSAPPQTSQPQSLDSSPPSSAPSGKLHKPATPFKVGGGAGSRRLSTQEPIADSAAATAAPPPTPQNGGFNVRFVQSAGSAPAAKSPPESKSPELKSLTLESLESKSPELKPPELKPPELKPPELKSVGLTRLELKLPELKSAGLKSGGLKSCGLRSPGLKSPGLKPPELKSPDSNSPEPKSPPESSAITRLDQLSAAPSADPSAPESKKEVEVTHPPPELEKITRSSFELARANLAGSLELTRLGPSIPPSGSPLQQESCAPKQPAAAEVIRPELSEAEDGDDDDDAFRPSPVLPGEAIVETVNLFAINRRRSGGSGSGCDIIPVKPPARSSSAQGRMPLISLNPDNRVRSIEMLHFRSASVTSCNRDPLPDASHTKTPSIRKIIRQTATQLRHLAETGTRMSRADRFAMESGNRKTPSALNNNNNNNNNNSNNNKTRLGKSIRKLLGMKKDSGSSKSAFDSALDAEGVLANVHKFRPEIVHPLDFHPPGQVEVVTQKPESSGIRDPMMASPNWPIRGPPDESPLTSARCPASAVPSAVTHSASFSAGSSPVHATPSPSGGRGRPPPPPRVNNLPGSSDAAGSTASPAAGSRRMTVKNSGGSLSQRPKRPPPPRAPDLLRLQKSPSPESSATGPAPSGNSAGEYANLGDIRHGMTPKKPERSASLRHSNQNISVANQKKSGDSVHYGCVSIQHSQQQQQQQQQQQPEAADEDGYIIPVRMRSLSQSFSAATSPIYRHSMSSFNPPSAGSAGSPQAGAIRNAGSESNNNKWSNNRSGDLRMKMEDHYGTVISANYQALSQLLDQATSKRPLAAHLHEMRRVEAQLSWNSFEATSSDAVLLRTRRAALLSSRWRCHDVLLLVYPMTHHVDSVENKAPFAQPSVIHFHDPTTPPTPLNLPFRNCGAEVFPCGQVSSLDELAPLLSRQYDRTETIQRGLVALLQLLRALSWLRLKRHEGRRHPELDEIVFYRENDGDVHRLIWMATTKSAPGASGASGMDEHFCMSVVERLAPSLTPQLVDKLTSINGLERMIGYIELTLFGPPEELNHPEMIQRWLDVERASVLNELIRTQGLWRIKLTVMEEFRLAYLVVANVPNLIEASRI